MSDNTKFTPGPWTWINTNHRKTIGDLVRVGRLYATDVIVESEPGGLLFMSQANARLIAAAPTLLAACEAMNKYLYTKADIVPFPAKEAKQIKKALSIAKGGAA